MKVNRTILGAFAKFRKQLLASLCLSVRPYETTRHPLDVFSLNLIFEHFSKNVEKIQILLKSDRNNEYFT
jgi:hypothetical protein